MFYLLDTVQTLLSDNERAALYRASEADLVERLRLNVDRAVHGGDLDARREALLLSWALVSKSAQHPESVRDRLEGEASQALRVLGYVDGEGFMTA